MALRLGHSGQNDLGSCCSRAASLVRFVKAVNLNKSVVQRRPSASNPYQSDIPAHMGHHLTVTRCCRLLQLRYASYRNLHASTRLVSRRQYCFVRSYEKCFGSAINVGKISLFQRSALWSIGIGKLWPRPILVDECDNLVTRRSHDNYSANSHLVEWFFVMQRLYSLLTISVRRSDGFLCECGFNVKR